MSISDTLSGTVGAVAASSPAAGAAVFKQSVGSAILAGLQTGDPGTASLLGAAGSRSQEVTTLLASLQPHLGQNVNTAV